MFEIDSLNVIPIIKSTLDLVDERLVSHGARVAFILEKLMLMQNKGIYDRTLYDICMLGFLHDIGACKTDDIDDMMTYDTKQIWPHSIYGYLFLSNMSPLAPIAEAIKFHHLNFNEYQGKYHGEIPENGKIALLIKLADRVDILIASGVTKKRLKKMLIESSGIRFCPEHVEFFLAADEKYKILDHIFDNSYTSDSVLFLQRLPFSTEELLDYLAMVALSIDFRSPHTVLHTITAAKISVSVAKRMGLSEETIEKIKLGALLHDVGKNGIPTDILEKPGALTHDEMIVMKSHVTMTRTCLTGNISPELCNIASRHHERLDGRGYPDGLTQSDLTIPEQIVAVADVLSALLGRRSYKSPFPKDVVVKELSFQAKKGMLCEEAIDICINNFDEIEKELNEVTIYVEQMYQGIKTEYSRVLQDCLDKNYFTPSNAPVTARTSNDAASSRAASSRENSQMKGILNLL